MIYDANDRFLFGTASTTLTGAVTLSTVGSSYTLAVTSTVGFLQGSTIFVTDGTHTLTGIVTSVASATSLVVTSTAQSGTSGTIATSGSSVAPTGLTVTADANSQNTIATITSSQPSLAIATIDGGTGLTNRMVASVRYNAATNASGSNNVTFVVQVSTDGVNWFDYSGAPPDAAAPVQPGSPSTISLSTTAQSGAVNLPFIAVLHTYFRVMTYITGSGSTPTITIASADLVISSL